MLSTMELIVALKEISLFAEVRGEALKRISDAVQEMKVSRGEIIFSERDRGDEMYIVHSGKVCLFRTRDASDEPLASLGPGAYFGELAIIDGEPRSASARADEDSTLLVLRKRDFRSAVLDHPDIAFAMFEELARRLRHANDLVHQSNDASAGS